MPDYIGTIEIPAYSIDGVFPLAADFDVTRQWGYTYKIHKIGGKLEQRILKSRGIQTWKIHQGFAKEPALAELYTFYDTHRNPRDLFYFYDPFESIGIVKDGASTTGRYVCRFLADNLDASALLDLVYAGDLEIIEVAAVNPAVAGMMFYYNTRPDRIPAPYGEPYPLLMNTLRGDALTDPADLTYLLQIGHFNYDQFDQRNIHVADRRAHVSKQFGSTLMDLDGDYVPRLLAWDVQQDLDSSDHATFVVDDSDLVFTEYAAAYDLVRQEVKFVIGWHAGGYPIQLWRGFITDAYHDSENQTYIFECEGGIAGLQQQFPTRTVSMTCPWQFNDSGDQPNKLSGHCPYTYYGSGGDPDVCDKSLDGEKGCVSHGMKNFFGGLVIKPQVAIGKLNDTGFWGMFQKSYSSASTPFQTVYGKVIPVSYGVGRQILDADIFEYRDESEFKVASAIIGEGPVGYANQGDDAGAVGQVLLDNLTNHYPYSPIVARGFQGQDIGTVIDPAFRCSELAFVSIRTTDLVNIQPPAGEIHKVLVELKKGVAGVRTYWWTGDLTLTRQVMDSNPIHHIYDLVIRTLGMQYPLPGGNDDMPRDYLLDVDWFLYTEQWSSVLVPKVVGEGTEPRWSFRGTLREQKAAIDWVRDLLACTPIMLIWSFGQMKFKPREDEVTTPPANQMIFSQSQNIIEGSFRVTRYKPGFNKLTLVYSDEDFNFSTRDVTVYDLAQQKRMGYQASPPSGSTDLFRPLVLLKSLTLPGVFGRAQVTRLAVQMLREELGGKTEQEQRDARIVSMKVPLVGLMVELGDVSRVEHELLPGGSAFVRWHHYRYTSEYEVELEGRTVVASMYGGTPDQIPSDVSVDMVLGTPGGSGGSTGLENQPPALTPPTLTIASSTYRDAIVAVDAPPPYTNYLIVEVSETEDFSTGVVSQILTLPVPTYPVSGIPGEMKYTRARWRRSTDPLEESIWSNVLILYFTKIQSGDIDLPDLAEHGIVIQPEVPVIGGVYTHGYWYEIKLRPPGHEGALLGYNQYGADWNPFIEIHNTSTDPDIEIRSVFFEGGDKDHAGFYGATADDLDYYEGVLPIDGQVTAANYGAPTIFNYGLDWGQGKIGYRMVGPAPGQCPSHAYSNEHPEDYQVPPAYFCKGVFRNMGFQMGGFSYNGVGGPVDENGVPTGASPMIRVRTNSRAATVFNDGTGRTVFPPTMPGQTVVGYYGTFQYDNQLRNTAYVTVAFNTGLVIRRAAGWTYAGVGIEVLPLLTPPHPLEDYFVFVSKVSMDNFDVFGFDPWQRALEFGAHLGEVSIEIKSRSDRFVIGTFKGEPLHPGEIYYVKVGARRVERWNSEELDDYAYSSKLSKEEIVSLGPTEGEDGDSWLPPSQTMDDLPVDAEEGDVSVVTEDAGSFPAIYYYHNNLWTILIASLTSLIEGFVRVISQIQPGSGITLTNTDGLLEIATIDEFARTAVVLGKSGLAIIGTSVTFEVEMPCDGIWESWHIKIGTAATGTDTIVNAKNNGTTIFSTRPTLPAGDTSSDGDTGFSLPAFLKGDIISYDVDQVGSGGYKLSLQLNYRQQITNT